MLTGIYRRIIPNNVRRKIYNLFLGFLLGVFRNPKKALKAICYYSIKKPSNNKEQAYKDWVKANFSSYPYVWKKEYDDQHFEINVDHKNNLPYVKHNGKLLYFKHDMISLAEGYYRSLLIEQDKRSAHSYIESYQELQGKVLLDIGAAEGIFALDVIEYVDHVYLFECDETWIEALEATFNPWRNKVTIVRKYVGDIDNGNYITLDAYFENQKVKNLFLKMDIEGYERKALKGATSLLASSDDISGAICIYHLNDDIFVMKNILEQLGKKISIQPGFIYFEKEMRSAVMRFESSEKMLIS